MPQIRLMAILNVTPDSFFAGSRFMEETAAVERGIQMYLEGANILDIGGESSRPGADFVDENEELRRVIPLIKTLRSAVPIPLSIDTYKPRVAEQALHAGASLVNDINGFSDPAMRSLAARSEVEICVMHKQGTPAFMQDNPCYPEGVVAHLINWFEKRVNLLIQSGIKEKQIILDPGIGFGKTVADNLEIIQNLAIFKAIGFPLLLGVSRKSFIAKILQKTTAELLPATLAVNTLCLLGGATILRVHDVVEHRDIIRFMERLKN